MINTNFIQFHQLCTYLPLLADRKSYKGSGIAGQVILASRLAG